VSSDGNCTVNIKHHYSLMIPYNKTITKIYKKANERNLLQLMHRDMTRHLRVNRLVPPSLKFIDNDFCISMSVKRGAGSMVVDI